MAQFSIRPARPEDCGTILELIRGIAEYEKMSDEVVATEETIRHAMFDEHVTRCLLAEGSYQLALATDMAGITENR